jgi:hypothetical protein
MIALNNIIFLVAAVRNCCLRGVELLLLLVGIPEPNE